jgi:hypothetical protein
MKNSIQKMLSMCFMLLALIAVVHAGPIWIPQPLEQEAQRQASTELCLDLLVRNYPDVSVYILQEECMIIRDEVELRRIDVALSDTLTPEKLSTAGLGDDQIKRILGLDSIEKAKLARFSDDRLLLLSSIEAKFLSNILRLDVSRIEMLSKLSSDELGSLSGLEDDELFRLTELDSADLIKVTRLSRDQIEKLANLDRETMIGLSGLDIGEIKAELESFRLVRKREGELLVKRTVAEEQFKEYEMYAERLETEYAILIDDMHRTRIAFNALMGANDEKEVQQARQIVLLNIRIIKNIIRQNMLQTQMNADITDSEAGMVMIRLDNGFRIMDGLEDDAISSKDRNDIGHISSEVQDEWGKVKQSLYLSSLVMLKSTISNDLQEARLMEKRLDDLLLMLEDQGYDAEELGEVMLSYSADVQTAGYMFHEVSELIEDLEEGKISYSGIEVSLLDIHALLESAHHKMTWIAQQVIEIGGMNMLEHYDTVYKSTEMED